MGNSTNPRFSRRKFIVFLGAGAAIAGSVSYFFRQRLISTKAEQLPKRSLKEVDDKLAAHASDFVAISAALLPSVVDSERVSGFAHDYMNWLSSYREGVQMLPVAWKWSIRKKTPKNPGTRYLAHLSALNTKAEASYGKRFALISLEDRRAFFTGILEDLISSLTMKERKNMKPGLSHPSLLIGGPSDHVLFSILAYWSVVPLSHNLTYMAEINPHTCRTLESATHKPGSLKV